MVYIGIKIDKKIILNKCNIKNNGRAFVQKQAVRKTINLILKFIK